MPDKLQGARKRIQQWRESRGMSDIEFGTSSMVSFLLLGTVFESVLFLLGNQYAIALPPIYLVAVAIVLGKCRKRLKGERTLIIAFFMTSVLAVPFSSLAITSPGGLVTAGVFDPFLNADFTMLLFVFLQISLVYSTALLINYIRRERAVSKAGPTLRETQGQEKNRPRGTGVPKSLEVTSSTSDIPLVRTLILEGAFTSAYALGWSVIDRSLESLTGIRGDREGAMRIGFRNPEFERFHVIRNAMIHDGYKPDETEALGLFGLLNSFVSFLTDMQKEA